MNGTFPSATLTFILPKLGSLGLSLKGHPGCGGIDSGSRNIIIDLIKEVMPAACVPETSAKKILGSNSFERD